jgi:PST family polysaccharide transporter
MEPQESSPLGARIAVGTLWSVGMRWGTRFLGIVSTLILARLLVPEDFGVIAKAALIYELLNLVTAFGLETALITNQSADRSHYNTVWTIHLLRGVLIALLLLGAAYPAALFFNEPALTSIVPCYAVVSVLVGAVNVGTVDFRKHFRFDLDFRLTLIRKIAGFATTIGIAFIYKTYWAFVAGTIVDAIAVLVASFALSRYRVELSLSRWREFVSFGGWMLAGQWIGAISTKLDTLLLSRFSNTSTLGLYTVSFEVAATPSTELAMPVARALMPGLSILAARRDEHQLMYVSTLALVLALAIPAAVGLSALAHLIVPVLLGSKWLDAIPFLQALALYGVTRAVTALSTSAFFSSGRADLLAKFAMINLATRIVVLTIAIVYFGAIGLAWGVVLGGALAVVTLMVIQHRVGILDAKLLMLRTWRIAAAATVMLLAVDALESLMSSLEYPESIRLAAGVLTGVMVFLSTVAVLWHLSGRTEGPESVANHYLRSRLLHSPG